MNQTDVDITTTMEGVGVALLEIARLHRASTTETDPVRIQGYIQQAKKTLYDLGRLPMAHILLGDQMQTGLGAIGRMYDCHKTALAAQGGKA